jgi:hypothetical protein
MADDAAVAEKNSAIKIADIQLDDLGLLRSGLLDFFRQTRKNEFFVRLGGFGVQ